MDVASNSGAGGRFELNGLPFTSANPGERAGDSILHVQIISGTGSQASGFLARVNAADNRLFVFTYTGVGTTNDSAPTLVADTLIYITGSYPV